MRVSLVVLRESVPQLTERRCTCPGAVSVNENQSSSVVTEKLALMC